MSQLEMVCTCDVDGRARAERDRIEAAARLGCPRESVDVAAALALGWVEGADVGVSVDQWFGVSAALPSGETLYVECDRPGDGIVALWLELERRREPRAPEPSAALVEGAVARFHADAAASALWEAHASSCSECQTKTAWKLCPTGKLAWEATCRASCATEAGCGEPDSTTSPTWFGL